MSLYTTEELNQTNRDMIKVQTLIQVKVIQELFGEMKSRVGRINYGKEKAQLIILSIPHQFSNIVEVKLRHRHVELPVELAGLY